VTTGFPIDREATAAWLGFGGLVENSIDAVASRDFVVDALRAPRSGPRHSAVAAARRTLAGALP
jgi:argininosuccinate lyase